MSVNLAPFASPEPEWTPGTYNETEEPLPVRNSAEDKDFLLIAMNEAKTQLEIAEAWALEFPENSAVYEALNRASQALKEAFKNVPS